LIAGTVLLLLVGLGETVRAHVRRPWLARGLLLLVALLASWAGITVLALGWPWTVGILVAGACFHRAFSGPRGILVGTLVLAAALALTSGVNTPLAQLPISEAFADVAGPLVRAGISVDVVVTAAAVFVFLGDASNSVVRAVMTVEGVTGPRGAGRREDAGGGQRSKVLAFAAGPDRSDAEPFRGGRYIGALERWLVVVLLPLGAYPVVVALLAAKGIVRFPEVSRDSAEGASAEYFLVGTLTSFALGLAAAGYLALAL
jgi:hypothetical protein